MVGKPPRFAHEAHLHRRHSRRRGRARYPRWFRQAGKAGHTVEMIAHAQLGVVACVIDALRRTAEQRSHTRARQIVGMDVVGVDVVSGLEHRIAASKPVARIAAGAVERVDAGDAQDVHAARTLAAERTQPAFGIHAPPGACRKGRRRPRFVDPRTAAIAVHAAGAAVDDAARRLPRSQRPQQVRGAWIGVALCWRRRQMQHTIGDAGQTRERGAAIQIALQRPHRSAPQLVDAPRRRTERDHPHPAAQQPCHTQPHIAAADDEQPFAAQAGGGDQGQACKGSGTIPAV